MQIAVGRGRGLREGPRRRVALPLMEDALWGVQAGMSSGRIPDGGDPGLRVPRGRRGSTCVTLRPARVSCASLLPPPDACAAGPGARDLLLINPYHAALYLMTISHVSVRLLSLPALPARAPTPPHSALSARSIRPLWGQCLMSPYS